MVLLAPLLLFLGGCAITAKGANDGVPQIGEEASPVADQAANLSGDPVTLVRDRLEEGSPSSVEAITSVTAAKGAVTVNDTAAGAPAAGKGSPVVSK